MSRVDEIRAMLIEGNEVIIANRAGSSLGDLLEEIDALRARCEAAERDLARQRDCLSCKWLDDCLGGECPADCKNGSAWEWRDPVAEGDAQSAPGGGPVSEVC